MWMNEIGYCKINMKMWIVKWFSWPSFLKWFIHITKTKQKIKLTKKEKKKHEKFSLDIVVHIPFEEIVFLLKTAHELMGGSLILHHSSWDAFFLLIFFKKIVFFLFNLIAYLRSRLNCDKSWMRESIHGYLL